MSSRDIVNLKALTAEYADQFSKEGKTASKGKSRDKQLKASPISLFSSIRAGLLDLAATCNGRATKWGQIFPKTVLTPQAKSKDPFARPSPGLVERLAAEARYDAKRRRFDGDDAGPSDAERQRIMEAKAKRYDRIKKGDLSGMTEREIKEAALDLDNMGDSSGSGRSGEDEDEEVIEYEDDLGRTRRGTRAEARANGARPVTEMEHPPENSAYAEVLQSNVIRGDQNFYPVYTPDADLLREKYKQAEEESRQARYDASKEIRDRAAGAYQFSLDDDERARQLAELKSQRLETERARAELAEKRMTAAQEARQRRIDERMEMLERKREEKYGGKENLARLRREKAEREAEALLAEVGLVGAGREEYVEAVGAHGTDS